jgi:DNA-binding XRE family transcriptional regulator
MKAGTIMKKDDNFRERLSSLLNSLVSKNKKDLSEGDYRMIEYIVNLAVKGSVVDSIPVKSLHIMVNNFNEKPDESISENTDNPFPNRLKSLRTGLGLNIKDLAKRSGLGGTSISAYERGIVDPTRYAICQLADTFKVSVDYLLGRINENNK